MKQIFQSAIRSKPNKQNDAYLALNIAETNITLTLLPKLM